MQKVAGSCNICLYSELKRIMKTKKLCTDCKNLEYDVFLLLLIHCKIDMATNTEVALKDLQHV